MNYIKTIIAVLVVGVIFALFFSWQLESCRSKKAEYYKGLYESEKTRADELAVRYVAEIETLLESIAARDNHIKILTTEIEVINKDVADKGKEIENLENELKGLSDKDAIIENLTEQVALWKERFSLAEGIIKKKDDVIFNLTEKYNAQLKISEDYKELYENEKSLHQIAIERLKIAEKRVGVLKFGGTIKTTVIAVMGCFIFYDVIIR